jgi:hypothetical protein
MIVCTIPAPWQKVFEGETRTTNKIEIEKRAFKMI